MDKDDIGDAEEYGDDGPDYAALKDIHPNALAIGLCRLPLLGGDVYLRMQAQNVSMVDHLLMGMEQEALQREFAEDRVPGDLLMLLSALTQMWIFSVYELLRTWRGRTRDIIKWAESGGLAQKLKSYEQTGEYHDYGKELRAKEIKKAMEDPGHLDELRAALDVTMMTYTRLEHVRVSLAKHVVAKSNDQPAHAPGYARLNKWCGALQYELARGHVSYDVVCRRDIADALRTIDMSSRPSKEDLEAFDAFMKGGFEGDDAFEEK